MSHKDIRWLCIFFGPSELFQIRIIESVQYTITDTNIHFFKFLSTLSWPSYIFIHNFALRGLKL